MNMTLSTYALPFGLRQVKLTPITGAGVLDTANAQYLPASRTFSFKETEDFEELQGDDHTVASHGAGPTVDWDLEGGGISLEIWAILSGGTVTTSGSTPNTIKSFTKKTSESRPYFQVEGRAISDSGGDFHMEVYRCKADSDLEAELGNGAFLLTKASGKGYGDEVSEKLYDFVHNETAVPLVIETATLVSIAITGSSTATVGSDETLVATGTYDDSSTAVITDQCAWTSTDGTKATVAAGIVTPIAAGSVNIGASLNGISAPAHAMTIS
jgi:hypothetical protein